MVLHSRSRSDNRYFLEEIGVNWYLDFNSDVSQVPSGANKVPFVQVPTDPDVWVTPGCQPLCAENIESLTDDQIASMGFLTRTQIAQMVLAAPGSFWYIFGEANRYSTNLGVPYMTPVRFAPVFRYLSSQIRSADSTAKIIGTSILNWDYTCIGCSGLFECNEVNPGVRLSGYPCGADWLKGLVSEYESSYGEKPPVDVWAIDAYPIDWVRTPNNAEEHAPIVFNQLEGMRQYLNTVPEYVDTPIWITEIAVHVGYEGWKHDPFPQIVPIEPYHWDKMSEYLIAVLDWLEANASSNKIDKWFFFKTWKDIVNVNPDGYMGISFFDGPDQGAALSCLGETYRSRALQDLSNPPPRVRCDADGNTVSE